MTERHPNIGPDAGGQDKTMRYGLARGVQSVFPGVPDRQVDHPVDLDHISTSHQLTGHFPELDEAFSRHPSELFTYTGAVSAEGQAQKEAYQRYLKDTAQTDPRNRPTQ